MLAHTPILKIRGAQPLVHRPHTAPSYMAGSDLGHAPTPHSWIKASPPPAQGQMGTHYTCSGHRIGTTRWIWPGDGLGSTHLAHKAKKVEHYCSKL